MNFDEKARNWDAEPERHERAAAVAEGIRRRIKLQGSMRALEYGCGTGLLSFALQNDVGHITLADNSPGMLEVLKEKIASAGVQHMQPKYLDLQKDPLPVERYDVIYTLLTLHHILDCQPIFHAFYHLLTPRGYLCVADLDKEDGTFHVDAFDGHHGFERKVLEGWVQKAGFVEVQFETIFQLKRMREGREKHYPMFLMIARRRE
ncbi:MAG: class I SAM-dependent methyltransferase [Chloroflexota bacterium]